MGIHHKAGRNSAKTDRIFKLFKKYLKKLIWTHQENISKARGKTKRKNKAVC